ncbi:hypothetical protein KC363_g168 [Hortaea werneckii]|nr:hypothetical protein KC363_g168 [Hortaea werneckii]
MTPVFAWSVSQKALASIGFPSRSNLTNADELVQQLQVGPRELDVAPEQASRALASCSTSSGFRLAAQPTRMPARLIEGGKSGSMGEVPWNRGR